MVSVIFGVGNPFTKDHHVGGIPSARLVVIICSESIPWRERTYVTLGKGNSWTQKVPAGMGYVGSQVGYVHFCLRTSYFSGDHVGHVLVLEPIDGENNQLHSLKVHKGRWVSWRGPLVGFPIFFISTVDFRLNGSP